MPDLDRRLLESDLDYLVEMVDEMLSADDEDDDADPGLILCYDDMREFQRRLVDFQRRWKEFHA